MADDRYGSDPAKESYGSEQRHRRQSSGPLQGGILIDVRVELLYFGVLKDILGRERETLELFDGAKVEDAIRLLRSRTSNDLGRVWDSMAVAVNREYARLPDVLHDGDELALLPPVSGGCVWETA